MSYGFKVRTRIMGMEIPRWMDECTSGEESKEDNGELVSTTDKIDPGRESAQFLERKVHWLSRARRLEHGLT